MLHPDQGVLLFIDVQGRLHETMPERERLDKQLELMLRGAGLLGIPIIASEQLPEKLGTTSEPFRSLLKGKSRIAKSTFSCCGELRLVEALEATARRQVVLVGIEAHVCVYQTAVDLLAAGYAVAVAGDAVASRRPDHRDMARDALRAAGAVVLPAEGILLAWLGDAADPRFRAGLELIK